MIFLDANVPMYLVGGEHPNRALASVVLARLARTRQVLVTDAEVLQEIVYRFHALRRGSALAEALDITLDLVTDVLAISRDHVLRAAQIVALVPLLSARDALHLAVMESHGIRDLFSFDAAFDRWPGVMRIH